MEREIRAQQPPRSVFAKCLRTYLKYKCSRRSNKAASNIPAINKRNADKNCSRAKGSEVLCSCLPGLQDPVIQYLNKEQTFFFIFKHIHTCFTYIISTT